MELHFRNESGSEIWVAVMFYSPDACAEYGQWGTRGWWAMPPGGEAYAVDTDNRYAYFYAETASGVVWSGQYGNVYVHQQPFDSCIGIGDNNPETRVVGMRELDLGDNDRYYVNLTGG